MYKCEECGETNEKLEHCAHCGKNLCEECIEDGSCKATLNHRHASPMEEDEESA